MSIRERNALHAPDRRQALAGGCNGKVNFASWSDAQRVVNRDTRRNAERRMPYHCRHCGGIHLGTVDPLMERVKRRPKVYFIDEDPWAVRQWLVTFRNAQKDRQQDLLQS